ncbi:hypothetical protein Fcan01_20263 [Folsomia candida]|uniref:Uncharacterized protein n=1 Tax=Folsomia candida TaxID=158441 RepID=A0A226DKS5_FOLCA|nr:hypothetical protein Fcan01_20263 [Folsomia candida]
MRKYAEKLLDSGFDFYKTRFNPLRVQDVMLKIFSVRLNYTITRNNLRQVGAAYITLFADTSYKYLIDDKDLWVFIGAKALHFKFQAYARRICREDYLALISPYDIAIWCFILSGTVLLVLLFKRFDRNGTIQFKEISLNVFVTVLDQPFPGKMNFYEMRALICAWFLGFVVVNNVYKSFMVSSLAAPIPLRVPSTLGELANWDRYPIQTITFTEMLNADKDEKSESILKKLIIAHILRISEIRSPKFSIFEKLQEKTKHCDTDIVSLVEFANSTFVRSSVEFSREEELVVGEVFAVIDSNEILWKLENILNFFSGGFKSAKNNDPTFYTNYFVWLTDANFFFVLFSRKLGQIVESGIFTHLQNLEKVGAQLNLAVNVKHMNVTELNWSTQFQKIVFGTPENQEGVDEAMDLAKLWVPFTLILVLLFLELVIFMGEIIYVRIQYEVKVRNCVNEQIE